MALQGIRIFLRKKSNLKEAKKKKKTLENLLQSHPLPEKEKRGVYFLFGIKPYKHKQRAKNPFSSLFLLLKQYLSLKESETSIFKPRLQSKRWKSSEGRIKTASIISFSTIFFLLFLIILFNFYFFVYLLIILLFFIYFYGSNDVNIWWKHSKTHGMPWV